MKNPIQHIQQRPSPSTLAGTASRILPAAMALLLLLPSCTQPRRTWTPEVDPASLNDTVYLHYLARTPLVTVDEGQRAVLMLVGSTDEWPTPEARTAELLRRGAIKEAWGLEADRLLSFGTLAHMLRVVCDAPEGVNDHIGDWIGWCDRRAAIQTCVYEGLLPYTVPYEPVSGGALVTALTRAEEYMSREPLPPQP